MKHPMPQLPRIVTPEGPPVTVLERYDLRVRIYEELRPREYRGHFLEMDLFVERDNKWVTIGRVNDATLQDAIILLQQAQQFIAKANGITLLPTVRMNGGAYYFDVRSGEFRNVDNPFDRIMTERVA
jgi:hypothetical protein